MAVTLLAATRDIGQLVILAIVFLGWVVKEVLEAQKRKRLRSPKPRSPANEAPKGLRRREPKQDVIYGTRPIPHLPGEPQATPAPTGGPTPAPARPRKDIERSSATARTGTVVEGGRAVTTLVETHTTTRTTESTSARRRRRASGRLGIAEIPGDMRAKTRSAILWSEVLGPCRAFRGPHRAPTFERLGRTRATRGRSPRRDPSRPS